MTAQVATVPAINPLPSPLSPKKRKGTPHRSPKATTDSDLTAVFITFPFITHTRDPADAAVKTKKQVRMNLAPSNEQRTDATAHLRRPSEKFPEPSTNNTNTITTTTVSQSTTPLSRSSTNASDHQASSALHARQISVKANVRFVGDSFYGSNRYWWTRAIRPSPALSTSSSDAGSPTGQDDGKDAEYDSSGNARGPESSGLERSPQSAGRGRGGRGRGGRGRGRGGRGRGGWAKKL
ncbi:hypothetical protein CcCBS67573_g08573 [Chytriomyces confervae]|uniref:Uncharacterized protein n=1 Tax=Chytriomyces confervae TaxID=246404 RepID=A0A507EIA5_9FUNG|nr:hypothetical protein CcCBS67573_g08573 [Chytriomyces confervae]